MSKGPWKKKHPHLYSLKTDTKTTKLMTILEFKPLNDRYYRFTIRISTGFIGPIFLRGWRFDARLNKIMPPSSNLGGGRYYSLVKLTPDGLAAVKRKVLQKYGEAQLPAVELSPSPTTP